LNLWDIVLGRKVYLDVMEDNDATILIIKSGKNPALRHISRTHGVNVSWLHEVFQKPEFRLHYQPTQGQCSDIFTKAFTSSASWGHACDLIGLLPDELSSSGRGGGNALQRWIDRLRQAQTPGQSKSGGERKKASITERASHDTLNTPAPTDATRTTAAACPEFAPALCAPLLPAFAPTSKFAAMASAGSASGSGSVAATPWSGLTADVNVAGFRGRTPSRDRRGEADRGRSESRNRGGKGRRDLSRSTNRSRSQSAFRDRVSGAELPDRLFTLPKELVKLCRHTATTRGITVSGTGWVNIRQAMVHVNHARDTLHRLN
jgi:hypothetical protein